MILQKHLIIAFNKSHAGPPSAYVAQYTYIFIHTIYNKRFSASRISGGYSTLKIVGSYKPDEFIFYFRVGLIHTAFYNAGDVARRGAMDRDRRTPIGWARGPPNLIMHVSFKENYNGQI